MNRLRMRTLTVAGAIALTGAVTAPSAHAAASSCSHDRNGPQICISTTGKGGTNPGTISTSWANPPKNRKTATVYVTHRTNSYAIKAKRSGGKIVGQDKPNMVFGSGKLCARYKGSSHTACVNLINRNV